MANLHIFQAAIRCEWRNLRHDPALWLVLAMILCTVTYALHNGKVLEKRQTLSVAAASVDEQKRLTDLRANLADIEAGKVPPPDRPYRDPRNAIFVGNGRGATNLSLPPHPLAITAVGQSDLYPPTVLVSTGSKDTFLFSNEIDNPVHLLAGSFDLAFVLVFVYPLWILALTYNLVSGEREQGTLALTASCSVHLRTVMIGKLLVRAGLPILFTLVSVFSGLIFFIGSNLAGTVQSLVIMALAIILYGAFWAALSGAVNGLLSRDSAYNALLLVAAWIGLLLIVPTLVNAWAETRYPSPSRAELVFAVRAAKVDADRERDAALVGTPEEHSRGGVTHTHEDKLERGSLRERTLRSLASVQAATARADEIIATHDTKLQQQHTLAERLAFASPAMLMYDALAEIAGTGRSRYQDFSDQVDHFHQQWCDFFVCRAKAERMLTVDDYDRFPRFHYLENPDIGTSSRVVFEMTGISFLVFVFTWLAAQGFRRCRVTS
ncbi:MAG: DUF3526 domain-containing protein [Proteobacteria bacterium]|nr:DUF3526 domain-containing protein [Pseudomonadota bacterium]MDP2104795.1 DUF3526 domain-containing protein [Desulfobulbaceae bacterium]